MKGRTTGQVCGCSPQASDEDQKRMLHDEAEAKDESDYTHSPEERIFVDGYIPFCTSTR